MNAQQFRYSLLLGAFIYTTSSSAQIYQWKDENGRTVISDKPPVGSVRQSKKTDATSSSAPTNSAKSIAEQELEFRKRQLDSRERAIKTEKEQTANAEQQDNCLRLRQQLQALESGERIVYRDGSGERHFLEDSAREQEISKLRQVMQNGCG